MQIGEVFDEIQEEYTQKMKRWVPHYFELIERLAGSFPVGWSPNRILDLGSGNGNITATLFTQFPHSQYTLLDASEKMMEEAKERFTGPQFYFYNALIQDAGFADNQFDLITASFSLHHLPREDKEMAIRSIYRWLKPGGYFAYADLFIAKSDPEHPAFFEGWERFVKSNGQSDDWPYLSEHYTNYDHPDNVFTQLRWLQELNFKEINLHILDNYWIYLSAQK